MMFGSSGIRGLANIEVTPQIALKFGFAIGSKYSNVMIAHDTRVSAKMIEMAVASGLLSAGSRVIMGGLMPTPTLALASKKYGCGIMITASHNPAQYIGMKVFKDGMSFVLEQQEEIEQLMKAELLNYVGWEKTGGLTSGLDEIAIENHKGTILKKIKVSDLSDMKVVVDCGCGAGSVITPYLLREMGCDVITLNSQPDGFFPGREPEPRDDTLDLLKKTVVSCGADVGIAHDGDADRMMAVDNNGCFVGGDKLLTLFALKEARTSISIPLDTSSVVDDLLPNKVKIYHTKVGDVYISESLKNNGGEFGGEQSGAMIFPEVSMCPDGIYAAARLIEILNGGGIFSDILAGIPQYTIKRYSYPCKDIDRTMIRIVDKLKTIGKMNVLDGVRVDLKEGWILVRPSGTEPKIRLTVESKNKDDNLFEKANDIVKKTIGGNIVTDKMEK